MKIHEYQGKEIFARYGIPTPKGIPVFSVDEAEAAAKKLIAETGTEVCVVKAQIHAGGRGKGGGVKVVKGAAAVRAAAEKLLASGQTSATKRRHADYYLRLAADTAPRPGQSGRRGVSR